MTILAALHHSTHYRFDRPVIVSAHEIRLKPAAHSRTPIVAYSLGIEPENHFIHTHQDAYGNFVARVNFPQPAQALRITVDLIADLSVINPFDFFIEPWAEYFPFRYPDNLKNDLTPFLLTEPQDERFDHWLARIRQQYLEPVPSIEFLVKLNQAVQQSVTYLRRLEHGVQTPEVTLVSNSGSCRDSAWLLVQILRHLDIAARFVSGYLIQLTGEACAYDRDNDPAAACADLHAWCEAYIPGAGWIGLDATSGLLTSEGHIPLAIAANPESASPVSGFVAPCGSSLDIVMTASLTRQTLRDPNA